MRQNLLLEDRPSARVLPIEIQDIHEVGTLGFMPRMFVLATLPHSQPKANQLERVNGRYSLRLEARRSIGLPYGIYPRLILAYLTTQSIRTKSREIELGRTPNDFARRLGLAPISGKRGNVRRLQEQLERLLTIRLSWRYSKDFRTQESGCCLITERDLTLEGLRAKLLRQRRTWNPTLVLSRPFFQEIARSVVPVELRAIEHLKGSPLATDIYIWLTYRMSYLRRPCLIPWKALELQFGATYTRSRDFRRSFCDHLRNVVGVYPALRLRQTDTGLMLHPSPPHVPARPHKKVRGSLRHLYAGNSEPSL